MKKVYLIAIVFALIAGFATFMFASDISEKLSYKDANKVTVYVAKQEVPANSTISSENFDTYFEAKEIVSDYKLSDALTNTAESNNAITRQTLYKGEQLTKSKLITSDSSDATLSLKIPDGCVTYSITASGTNSGDGYFAPGDKVDIYVYNGAQTQIPLKNLEILMVSSKADNDTAETDGKTINSYSTLTLLVTQAQAEKLMSIEYGGSKYKLVLKPRAVDSNQDKIGDKNNSTATANNSVDL